MRWCHCDLYFFLHTVSSFTQQQIYSLTPSTAITDGGTLITIDGYSFSTTGSVTIGGTACTVTVAPTTWSSNRIVCALAAGQGTGLVVQVTTGGQKSNTTVFSYLPPTITGVTPASGPTAGGFVITVLGSNFGLQASTYLVNTYSGTNVTSLCTPSGTGQNHELIECVVGSGQGSHNWIYTNVSNQISNYWPFAFDAPVIQAFSPNVVSTAGTTQVVMSGLNFGNGAQFTLYVNNVALTAGAIVSVNHTTVVFVAPAGTGTGYALSCTVSSQTSTYQPSYLLNYAPPTITSVSGCLNDVYPQAVGCSVSGGQTITIVGGSFGATAAGISVTVGGSTCINVTLTTAQTTVTCVTPSYPTGGYNLNVNITVGGQTGSAPYLSFQGPTISPLTLLFYDVTTSKTLNTTADAAPSTMVTYSDHRELRLAASLDPVYTGTYPAVYFGGYNFGTDENAVSISYIAAGKTYTCSLVAGSLRQSMPYSNSSVACTLAIGVGANLTFVIKAGLLTSPASADTFSYPPPAILPNSLRSSLAGAGMTDYTGQYSSGDVVFFTVTDVGNDASLLSVTYSRPSDPSVVYTCSNVAIYAGTTNTSLSCLTAAGTGSGYVFTVTALNQASAPGTDTYNYVTPPTITSVTGCTDVGNGTTNCPTIGGITLTVTGTAFGSSTDTLSVSIGTNVCTNVVFVATTKVTCTLGQGAGSNLLVTLFRNKLFSPSVAAVSYAPANVTAVSGCIDVGSATTGCARAGGSIITLTGSNFGPALPTILVGGSVCSSVAYVSPTDPSYAVGKLSCTTPSGSQQQLAISVIPSGGDLSSSDASVTVSYAPCAPGTYSSGTVTCFNCQSYIRAHACESSSVCNKRFYAALFAHFLSASLLFFLSFSGSAGSYQDAEGQSTCLPCANGFASNITGATACAACVEGTYASQAADGSGAIVCSPCPVGDYNALTQQAACTQCALGSYSNVTGATTCTLCERGTFAGSLGLSVCTSCFSGYYSSAAGAGGCTACPLGTYAPVSSGATACVACAAGTVQPSPASTTCVACQLGQYRSESGQGACLECDAGTFSNTTGMSMCYQCPAGSFSTKDASGGGAHQCTLCARGTYNPLPGQANCLNCE